MCATRKSKTWNSRKYPYLPHGRYFFYDPASPQPFLKFLLSFAQIPPGNSNPFCVRGIFSGTAQ